MNFGPQTKLEVRGKARHEAARLRNSECKINLSSLPTQQWQSVGLQRSGDWPPARHIGRCAALRANHRCAVGLLPLPREEFRLLKLILHSELRRRAASRRALPCPSSYLLICIQAFKVCGVPLSKRGVYRLRLLVLLDN